jgi:hypothetical protein
MDKRKVSKRKLPPRERVTLLVLPQEAGMLRELAEKKGMYMSALVGEWIREAFEACGNGVGKVKKTDKKIGKKAVKKKK